MVDGLDAQVGGRFLCAAANRVALLLNYGFRLQRLRLVQNQRSRFLKPP